ncbi:chromo domain [Trichoderma cornu-damae]|uniref:Chromo domain n=1 Tax=Trichoderma cornu-damae TaxID=654480 RepID=A0A9P8QPM6_9HYPO|nr:chromo domain [Trichoderma cornu-damae]
MPSPSITKGTKGTKRAVRKVGRPPKAVTPQKGKSPAKEDEAAKDVSSEPEEQEWEVERIVGSKLDKTTLEHWYKVKWKGYTNKFNTWELKRNLANCKDLVDEYEEMVVDSDYEATIGNNFQEAEGISRGYSIHYAQ